jgi:hypothetical protein
MAGENVENNDNSQNIESAYINALIEKAEKKRDSGLVDINGALIVDIKKTDIEHNKQFTEGAWNDYLANKKPSTTIYLHNSNQDHAIGFAQVLEESRGSLNPLLRQVYFHMRGIAEIIKESVDKDDYTEVDDAYSTMITAIQQQLETKFTELKSDHTKDNNIAAINHELDVYSKKLLDDAYDKFQKELSTKTLHISEDERTKIRSVLQEKKKKSQLTDDQIDDQIKNAWLKSLFKKLKQSVGSSNDLLYVDGNNIMFASGNEHSSHNKKIGAKVALVNVRHFHKNDEGKITANDDKRHYTVPSYVDKHSVFSFLVDTKKYVGDAKAKTKQIYDRFEKDGMQPDEIIVYNLYTSLNNKTPWGLNDERSNRQSQSAKYILLGVHAYNKDRMTKGKDPNFFVQNIPVNGHGYPLSYSINPLVSEATLMTEMSLLMTLGDENNKRNSFNSYKNFVNHDFSGSNYFSKSSYGQGVRQEIDNFKNSIKTAAPIITDDFKQNIKECLKLLMAHDCHFRNDAIMFQALSVFVEPNSVAGCKSSIDRTPMVENRISTLERILAEPGVVNDQLLSRVKNKIEVIAKMGEVDRGNSLKVKAAEKELEAALNEACNQLDVQSGATMIANARIGGAPKYLAKAPISWKNMKWNKPFTWPITGHIYNLFDTNQADSPSMTNVAQSKPGQMHGGPAKKAFKGFLKVLGLSQSVTVQGLDSESSRLSSASILSEFSSYAPVATNNNDARVPTPSQTHNSNDGNLRLTKENLHGLKKYTNLTSSDDASLIQAEKVDNSETKNRDKNSENSGFSNNL